MHTHKHTVKRATLFKIPLSVSLFEFEFYIHTIFMGNSISNHPEKIENVTRFSQIFFKLSPVVGMIKTRQS